jgi:hypothetical protein
MTDDEHRADSTDGGGTVESEAERELGVDLGSLAKELDTLDYPTTTGELLAEFGDHDVEMHDGSQSVAELLGERTDEGEAYESADEVRRMLYNVVGVEAVGREGYSDRGGIAGDREDIGGREGERRSF